MRRIAADTCIIGSGVAGAVLARDLLRAGSRDIVMLEVGPKPRYGRRAWLDAYTSPRTDPHHDRFYREADVEQRGASPFLPYTLRGHGGSTVTWKGVALRLMPEDFRLFTNTGRGADWPIAYEDLEPYYTIAEQTLHVCGSARDPGHPPRRGDFPFAAIPFEASDGPFVAAIESLGYGAQHACLSRATEPDRGHPMCEQVGTCQLCPLGARFSAADLLDTLAMQPGLRVLPMTPALRFRFGANDRVAVLDALDVASGARVEVEAERFVIAAGTCESVKLLLASACAEWPDGLGGGSGDLGRYVYNHWALGVLALHHGNGDRLYKELDYETAWCRRFDDQGTQADGKFIFLHRLVNPPVDEMLAKGETLESVRTTLETARVHALVFQLEEPPQRSNRLLLGSGEDEYGLPNLAFSYAEPAEIARNAIATRAIAEEISKAMDATMFCVVPPAQLAHPMGGCRMSAAPDSGVVDADLRVHGTHNVYVCSAAVYPSGGTANPTLTVVALAHRLAEHLARG